MTDHGFLITPHIEPFDLRNYFWPGRYMMKPYLDLYLHTSLLLTNTEDVACRVVLPTGPTMDDDMIRRVAAVLRVLLQSAA